MKFILHRSTFGSALAASLALLSSASALGQTSSALMRFETRSHRESSGVHLGRQLGESRVGSLDESIERETRHFTVVRAEGANLMRIHFSQFDLDRVSEIHLTSIADGATQRFTHDMLEAWGGWSAIFNGDAVLVQLLVAPEESVSFEIDEVAVNVPPDEPFEGQGEGGIASICGSDNRVASTDSRVGRLSGANCGTGGGCGGCTAWLTSIGSALTAGHCGTASGGLIEFNVPDSSAAGLPVAAAPEDQYPVGQSYYALQEAGVGFDWAIMDVGPNANTGLRAHWVQGYFHLDPDIPSNDTTLRITGYGVDNSPTGSAPSTCCAWSNGSCIRTGCNSDSLTLQTSTGPKSSHATNSLEYAVDTEPANSGSPVIVNSSDFAIGIHTNGGCTSSGGANSGTRLTQAVLAEYLDIFLGDNTIFVDFANVSPIDLGSALNPLPTVTSGISAAPTGGTVAIAGGTYSAASGHVGTFTKAVTLRAVSGNVTIGN
jgi:V8-like Glu-specific endopeptidase